MKTLTTSLVAVLASLSLPVAAAPAVPAALADTIIYAAPVRIASTSADLEPASTFDVFIDGKTGFAFVRTPNGWKFVRSLKDDSQS